VIGIAQILRNVACNMHFETQKYFVGFNDLIDEHQELMKKFLLNVVQIPLNKDKNFTIDVAKRKKKDLISTVSGLLDLLKI
jgi:hypothetical protein